MPHDAEQLPQDSEVLRIIAEALKGLQFGQVLITVHDRHVVRIERTERIRLDADNQLEKGLGI